MSTFNLVLARYDRFLFASCDPRICGVLRILVAIVLVPYLAVWYADAAIWFTDAGVLTHETASELANWRWSLFNQAGETPQLVFFGLSCMAIHTTLLLVGYFSRIQSAGLFFWLAMFHHRNSLITDGEDTVLRLLMFAMVFMPLDCILAIRRRGDTRLLSSAWALRLVQFELTAIYLSTAFCKWQGESWREGTALYLVSRMDDVFGKFYLPDWPFETLWVVQLMTWCVLAIETLLPICLWIRPVRKWAIVAGVVLHLSIEYAMHLFLFEWIMIIGLFAFVRPAEWRILDRSRKTSSKPKAATLSA